MQFVCPELADKIRRMASILAGEGIEIRVTQGLRSVGEQDALYAIGRTKPGEIVTNCPGGSSWHNYGLAVDVVPSKYGPGDTFDPDWNENHPVWKRMIACGENLGLESGSEWRTFKDYPHFQLTGRFPSNQPTWEVRRMADKGLPAIWAAALEPGPIDPGGELGGGG